LNVQGEVMANRILLNLGPLRASRDFRLLFAAQLVSMIGSQLTVVAVPFQVYALTRSSLQVGAVSPAAVVPLIAGALIGGSVADAVDRRRLLAATSAVLAVASGALAVNAALAHPSLVAVYLAAALAAGLGGLISTAVQAVVPALVGKDGLVAAYASMQIVDQVGMVAGPALSGVLITGIGLSWVYACDALTFVAAAVTALAISALTTAKQDAHHESTSILGGVRYLRGRQALQGAFLIDLAATVFGQPRALFPALAARVFGGGTMTLGLLYAAPGVGALAGALSSGRLERVRRQGWTVVLAVGVWGTAIAAFGLVHLLWAALVLLALAGWADVISAVLRTTIVQSSVPEWIRARISALEIATVEGGPQLGNLEAGAVGGLVSAEFAVVSGGIACCIIGAALVAGLRPGFRRYHHPGQPDGTMQEPVSVPGPANSERPAP
jgi:predicted MFS family arabinose efflux permease